MANILDLRTVGNNTIYVVDDIPSLNAGTPAEVGSIAMFDGIDVAEVSKALFLNAGSYYDIAGAYAIQLYDGTDAGHYFWFNVTDGAETQVDPSLVGTGYDVEILAADTAAQIAVKFAVVVDALSEFSAPVPSSTVVTITNAVGGDATDASGDAAQVSTFIQGRVAGTFGQLYLKIGVEDTAWSEIVTNDSQSLVKTGDYRKLAIYSVDASGEQVDDTIEQNTHPISIIIDEQLTRNVGIVYQVPNPGDNIASADFVLTEGDQTIYGDKTFGTSVNPADIRIYGSLVVEGTITYIETEELKVTDKLITLNHNGLADSAAGSGLEFEEDGAITGYIKVNSTRDGFLIKAPESFQAEFLFDDLTANHIYTWQDLDGIVALQATTAGVDTQISFYNADGLLDSEIGVDEDSFTWDYTNKYLGIRTAAPARPLDVNGSAIVRGAFRIEKPTSLVNYEVIQEQVSTTNATATALHTLATATGTVMLIEARILAKCTVGASAGSSATYIRTFRVKNVGGTVTVHHLDSMYTSEDVFAWNVTVAPSSTNVVISVVGQADNTITWDATTMIQVL